MAAGHLPSRRSASTASTDAGRTLRVYLEHDAPRQVRARHAAAVAEAAARDAAKRASKDALASKHERVRQVSSNINHELLGVTLKAATAEGMAIFKRMKVGE